MSFSLKSGEILHSSASCLNTSCINEKIDSINVKEKDLVICGDFYLDKPVLVYSNVKISSCETGASLIMPKEYKPESKGYENAFIKLKRPKKDGSFSVYSDIEINGIVIKGNAHLESFPSRTIGISITANGWDFAGGFSIKNLKITKNNISDLDSNGIVIGNPNNKYFNNKFYFQDVLVSGNSVQDLESSGAGIIIVDESIPEVTYSELGYLDRYRLDRITASENYINNVYSDANNRIHGAGFGLIVDGAKHVSIHNNTVGKYAEEGIRVYDSNFVEIYKNKLLPSYPLIDGNAFNANGIKLNRVANASINNNEIDNSSGPGVELYGTAKVDVFSNKIKQKISHGIRIEDYLVLDNSLCRDNPAENKKVCLFRNRWIRIFDNSIEKKCGCIINTASEFDVYDFIEMDFEGVLRNLKSLSKVDLYKLKSCKSCQ